LFSSCLDDRGKTGETSPCFCFQGTYRVLCKNVLKVKGGTKVIEKRTNVLSNVFVKGFLCDIVFLKRRNVSEEKNLIFEILKGKPFFWIWRMNVA
jgi:hypothetical protein